MTDQIQNGQETRKICGKKQAELKERREQRGGKKRKSDDDYPWCRPEREWRAVSEVVVYLGGPRRERMRGSK